MDIISDVFANSPIVFDIGSSTFKLGFAGEEKPRTLVNAQLGKPKYKALPIANQQDLIIGNQIKDENRGLFKLRYPVEHGNIQSFSDFEHLVKYSFNELKVNVKEYAVLLTEPPFHPQNQKN